MWNHLQLEQFYVGNLHVEQFATGTIYMWNHLSLASLLNISTTSSPPPGPRARVATGSSVQSLKFEIAPGLKYPG